MCLHINEDMENKKPNKDGFCSAWKVVTKDNTAPFKKHYVYKIGLNASEFRDTYFSSYISNGLHLFLKRDDARELKKTMKNERNTDCKIIKVFYNPEDVIAYGEWDNGEPSVAVNKLMVKSLNGV